MFRGKVTIVRDNALEARWASPFKDYNTMVK